MRFLLSALFIVLLGTACSSSGSKSDGDESAAEMSIPQENLVLVNLEVKGMTCEGCEKTVVTSIRKLEGIQEARASFTAEETIVKFDSTKTSIEAISQAIADAGYKVEGEKAKSLQP
ncbi:cation transporter [Bacteroidota bacterium]